MLRLLLLIIILYFAVRAVRGIIHAVSGRAGANDASRYRSAGRMYDQRWNGNGQGVRRRDLEQIEDAKFRDVR